MGTQTLPHPKPKSAGTKPGASNAASAAEPTTESLTLEVERIFCELGAQVARLEDLAGRRRMALAHADTRGLADCIAAENIAVQRVADLEKLRVSVARTLAARLGWSEQSELRVSWLGRRVGGALGERLTARAVELRERLEALARSNQSAELAARTLAAHMEGLWRQAASVLNHSKTYARTGAVLPGASVVSALDVQS